MDCILSVIPQSYWTSTDC